MKRIGLLVAVEIDALLNDFGTLLDTSQKSGFTIYHYQMENSDIYVIHSGAGELAAAAATQLLISVYEVEAVFNFGVVGGLTKAMALAKSCVVTKVVHYDYDTSALDHCEVGRYLNYPSIYIPTSPSLVEKALEIESSLVPVVCASGDKFIDGQKNKEALHQAFQADICEMEAAAIVLTCNRANIPCLLVKTVSDAISGGAEDFNKNVQMTASICLKIMKQIILELEA